MLGLCWISRDHLSLSDHLEQLLVPVIQKNSTKSDGRLEFSIRQTGNVREKRELLMGQTYEAQGVELRVRRDFLVYRQNHMA